MVNGFDDSSFMCYVGGLEKGSEYLLVYVIFDKVKGMDLKFLDVEDFDFLNGKGVIG